jgi:ribonuclease HI
MVYTDGSIMGNERGVGVYFEAKGFEERYKIEQDVPISSTELKAIESATNFIFQQDEQRAVILTDSRTACQILMKAMEGDRHNKIVMRIMKGIQKTNDNKMDSSTRRVRRMMPEMARL